MKKFKNYRFIYVALTAVLLLSACIPTTTSEGTIIDATEAAALVETAVVQALNAQATQIAESVPEASPTTVATNTPIPAPATLTPVATNTQLVLVPAATATTASGGGGSSGGGGGGTTITYPDACDPDIHKRPYDNTEMRAGDPFDIKFMIENTGTTTWAAGRDLHFWSGPDMTDAGFPFIELPEMKPGARFQVGPLDATAPATSGFHVMTMKLEGGFCWPYVAINVK